MQLGIVGLGRMGANIGRRLMRAGHQVVGFDASADAVKALDGATPAADLAALVAALAPPRAVWVMLPAGRITEETIAHLGRLLSPGDTVIDGGNTFYKDDIRRAKALHSKGVDYVDCGTSGGVWGLERGYCMMIGGDAAAVQRLDPIFAALAPGEGSVDKTPGREGRDPRVEKGYMRCGPAGSGHFVKMVHNGIEYGLMRQEFAGTARRPALRSQSARHRRSVAARQRGRVLAAGSHGRGAGQVADAAGVRRQGGRQR